MPRLLPASGLNVIYLAFGVHTFIHEQIIVQALGLERKQYAYRVLLQLLGSQWGILVNSGKTLKWKQKNNIVYYLLISILKVKIIKHNKE